MERQAEEHPEGVIPGPVRGRSLRVPDPEAPLQSLRACWVAAYAARQPAPATTVSLVDSRIYSLSYAEA